MIKDHEKRLKVTEQRLVAAETKLAKANATISLLSAAQYAALATISSAKLTDIALLTTAQWLALATFTPANITFLSGLSQLPHQTNTNSNVFSNAAFTGLANAVNNLQTNLQGFGYEF